MSYRPIGEYGLIGDCRGAALVAPDGSIDWFCWPRFDSPSLFASILDSEIGGRWQVGPAARRDGQMEYVPDTAILRTEHGHGGGVLRVTDAMLYPDRADEGHSTIIRVVEAREGPVTVVSSFQPAPAFGMIEPELELSHAGAHLRGAQFDASLLVNASNVQARAVGRGTIHSFDLDAGEQAVLVLCCDGTTTNADQALGALEQCHAYWRDWCRSCRYEGEYEQPVTRSAITLKLLTYTPSGAIVAAPTTSLPEQIGGIRNWDYRYTWLRDASMTIYALLATDQTREAKPFIEWICARVGQTADIEQLRIMYAVDGSADIEEDELDHLDGYRHSRPVRVGNGAVHQLQLDVYGEVLDCLLLCSEDGDLVRRVWPDFRRVVDWVADNWQRPDAGIWEMRTPPRHYVYSKVMAWAALERGCRIAKRHRLDGDTEQWAACADQVRAQILERGFNAARGAFVQAYDSDELDASNLLIPLVGFLAPDDERVHATIDATLRELTENGLVYRYRNTDQDGIGGQEGAFAICTFWLVSALAVCGRSAEARRIFEGALEHASPLGLYAEQIDPAGGQQLGNYPQAFTHVGLIAAALHLSKTGAVDATAGGAMLSADAVPTAGAK